MERPPVHWPYRWHAQRAEWAKQDRIQQFPSIYLLEDIWTFGSLFLVVVSWAELPPPLARSAFALTAELLAQGQTAQFTGGDAEYDAYVKLASNENNWGPPPIR